MFIGHFMEPLLFIDGSRVRGTCDWTSGIRHKQPTLSVLDPNGLVRGHFDRDSVHASAAVDG